MRQFRGRAGIRREEQAHVHGDVGEERGGSRASLHRDGGEGELYLVRPPVRVAIVFSEVLGRERGR